MAEFNNASDLTFTDISNELYREYRFGDDVVHIEKPLKLNVSLSSGGHRIWDEAGISHYIPAGWIHLIWESKPDKPNFDF